MPVKCALFGVVFVAILCKERFSAGYAYSRVVPKKINITAELNCNLRMNFTANSRPNFSVVSSTTPPVKVLQSGTFVGTQPSFVDTGTSAMDNDNFKYSLLVVGLSAANSSTMFVAQGSDGSNSTVQVVLSAEEMFAWQFVDTSPRPPLVNDSSTTAEITCDALLSFNTTSTDSIPDLFVCQYDCGSDANNTIGLNLLSQGQDNPNDPRVDVTRSTLSTKSSRTRNYRVLIPGLGPLNSSLYVVLDQNGKRRGENATIAIGISANVLYAMAPKSVPSPTATTPQPAAKMTTSNGSAGIRCTSSSLLISLVVLFQFTSTANCLNRLAASN
jgi:hypothetical protein